MRQCSVCGKGSIMRASRIKLRGNYNPAPKKRKYPNLQKSRLPSGEQVLACTKCIKKLYKQK